jgi:exodeoxyribonuclease-3
MGTGVGWSNIAMKIITLNLNGIRSAARKGFFNWMPRQRADLICVQELKCQPGDMTDEVRAPRGYKGFFHCAERKGYSGVGMYCRRAPDRVEEGLGNRDIDQEGRYLRADFGPLTVISVYLPSGSSGPERQAIKFKFMEYFFPHLKELAGCGREIVLCGDWNIAHKEVDLKNWRGNRKNSGFLPEEREWLTRVFKSRPGVGKERGMAHRLPDRHPEIRGHRQARRDIQEATFFGPRAAYDRLRFHVAKLSLLEIT